MALDVFFLRVNAEWQKELNLFGRLLLRRIPSWIFQHGHSLPASTSRGRLFLWSDALPLIYNQQCQHHRFT